LFPRRRQIVSSGLYIFRQKQGISFLAKPGLGVFGLGLLSGEGIKVVKYFKALKRKGYPGSHIKPPHAAIVRASLKVKP